VDQAMDRDVYTGQAARVDVRVRLPRGKLRDDEYAQRSTRRGDPLARYAAPNANFVLVVAPHNGLGRAERAKKTLLTRRGLCRDIKGRALDWLGVCRKTRHPAKQCFR
jgi:hypothetical protein